MMSSTGSILRPSFLKAVNRGGGASTIPLVTRAIGSMAMLNGITTFEPGASIPMHSHNCEDSVLVLEDDCIVVIDGVEQLVGPHDMTFVPSNVPHRFINASGTSSAKIFWTYSSIEATRTILATGETRPVSAEHLQQWPGCQA